MDKLEIVRAEAANAPSYETEPRVTRTDLNPGDAVRFRFGARDKWRHGTIAGIRQIARCSDEDEEIAVYIKLENGKTAVVSEGIGAGRHFAEHALATIEKL